MSIGENIKKIRESHNLSQKEFASIASVTDKAVSTWELDINVPRMGVIQKIADYFNISKSDIIEEKEEIAESTFGEKSNNMQTVKDELASNFLYYRKKSKLTQKDLAEKLDVKHNAISSWENGTNSIDTEMLFKACEVFGVSINDLYGKFANKQTNEYTEKEQTHIKKYRLLDERGKETVDVVLDNEYSRINRNVAPIKKEKPYKIGRVAAFSGENEIIEYTKEESDAIDEAIALIKEEEEEKRRNK